MYFPSFAFWRTAPLLASAVVKSIGPAGDLYILNGDTTFGNVSRVAVLAGTDSKHGTFPGPIISGKKGDTFVLNVHNLLSNTSMLRETTIHWHGIDQNQGTNWADGVAFVTQCPIIPGDTFTYKFPVLTQAGTYWYHSHYSTQYCDGLRGALIIRDDKDPNRAFYDIDDDNTVITLADWYGTVATRGRSRWNLSLINGQFNTAVVMVQPGKRYRFRIINMSCDAPYLFSIDEHYFSIIEADGVNVQDFTVVDQIPVYAAQRYSIIVQTDRNPLNKNYWIRAVDPSNPDDRPGKAILRYAGGKNENPTTQPQSFYSLMKETQLHAMKDPVPPGNPTPGGADININLNLGFDTQNGVFTINGRRFRPPSVPVLTQILSGAADPKDILPEGSVYSLAPNKSVELTFLLADGINAFGGPHPFHLHGHSFSVVRSAGSNDYNWKDPVQRDTVATSVINGTTDQVTLRFRTDNHGPWILHCHIDWHLETGLAVVFAEDINGTAAAVQKTIPKQWNDLCPKYWNYVGLPSP